MAETSLLSLTSPAGADALLPLRLHATEAISGLFRFEVDVSAAEAIDPLSMLDKPACVTLRIEDGSERHFHGIVSEFGETGREGTHDRAYRMVLQPRLLSAALSEDCRLFFKKGADDIIKAVLGDCGVTALDFKVPAATARDSTAQFNETALHFVTRLMEEEGWYYFFTHTAEEHTLVVAKANSAFPVVPGATLHFAAHAGTSENWDALTAWHAPGAVAQGQVSLADYDPSAPDKKLEAKTPTLLRHASAAKRAVFHWPALTDATGTVTDRTKLRMEAAEAGVSLVRAAGRFGGLFAGGRFDVQDEAGTSTAYVVQRIEHTATDMGRRAGGGRQTYANSFSAFPNTVPWREPATAHRPRMEGLHTALVLGPQGEEIHTDAQGRVKIRFFWDWRKTATADNSPFVRVIQPWAGNGWGGQFIPRVGTEVAVAFMDADPDRPVVVGGFYNGTDKPIYPDSEKTKSGFRSRSSLKGGTADFNEFTFDDKKGEELVYIHAQKDLKAQVENDEIRIVDHDRTLTVKGQETVTIKGNRTHEVTEGHFALTLKQGNQDTKLSMGDQSLLLDKGNQAVTLKMGNQDTKLSMGNHSTVLDMGNHLTQAKLGDVKVKADVGNITLEALQSITLKVGQSSLKLDQMGVELKGMMVKIDGQLMTEVKSGLMTETKAGVMLTLKGAITMIN